MSADTILADVMQWGQRDLERRTLCTNESDFEERLRYVYRENFNNAMKMVKKKLCPDIKGSAADYLFNQYLGLVRE